MKVYLLISHVSRSATPPSLHVFPSLLSPLSLSLPVAITPRTYKNIHLCAQTRPGEILVQEDKRMHRLTYPEMVEIDSVETQPTKNKYLCSDRWIAVFHSGITIYARNESDGEYQIKASVNGPTWRPDYSGGGSWLALNKCAVIAEDLLFYISQNQYYLVFCNLTYCEEVKSSQLSPDSIPFIPHFEIERTSLLPPGTKDNDDKLACPICLEVFEDNSLIKSTFCLHIFHENCLYEWMLRQPSCPLCRREYLEELDKMEVEIGIY